MSEKVNTKLWPAEYIYSNLTPGPEQEGEEKLKLRVWNLRNLDNSL